MNVGSVQSYPGNPTVTLRLTPYQMLDLVGPQPPVPQSFDNVSTEVISSRVPAKAVQFERVGHDEYFMGGPSSTKPASAPTPMNVPAEVFKSGQPVAEQPARFRYGSKVAEGFNDYVNGTGTGIKGLGQTLAGASKTVLYTPLGLIEGLGRSAVALTGGKTVYEGATPISRIGEGLAESGHGLTTIAQGAGQRLEGVGKMVVYAPLAGLELTARATGVAAGAVAAGAYMAYKGAQWTGQQVKQSFVGQEFLAGFDLVARNKPKD